MIAPARSFPTSLRAAARLCGVATSYRNFAQQWVRTPDSVLIRMINALQDTVVVSDPALPEQLAKLSTALRQHRQVCGLTPSLVAWDGVLGAAWLWLQSDAREIEVTLQPEQGAAIAWRQATASAHVRHDGRRLKIVAPRPLPFGYYTLEVHAGGKLEGTSLVIAAPRRIAGGEKSWGLFAPVYALKTGRGKSIGDFGDLLAAASFVKAEGGEFLGILPVLAGDYSRAHHDASPYSPVSRLFWNEIYLDVENLPGVKFDGALQQTAAPLVDYPAAYAEKAAIIARAADLFFTNHPKGDDSYRAYAADNPCLPAYAAHRAASQPAAGRKKIERYHCYAQYACHYQMRALRDRAKAGQCAQLYIDYPVGTDSAGFDAQHFDHLFMDGFQVGAPPDLFFSQGQGWGFRPFHPRALEHDNFSYFRATIQHYFRYARMLRIDHVMGLYRLYCIPQGASPAEGAYIYYPFEALLGVLCLEAHRHDGVLVGEDLGTVPDAVDDGLKTHNLNRMWVAQFEIEPDPETTFAAIEPATIASLNTHDMFPFAAFLTNADVGELQRLGLLDDTGAATIIKDRSGLFGRWQDLDDPLRFSLARMARSDARFVMVAVEDLWRETAPQNIPGTTDQYPNWRKRMTVPVEQWAAHDDVRHALTLLNRGQDGKNGKPADLRSHR